MTAVLTLNLTLEEAQVLAQALDLLASSEPRSALISAEWPNIEVSRTDDDNPDSPRWVTPPLTCPCASMT